MYEVVGDWNKTGPFDLSRCCCDSEDVWLVVPVGQAEEYETKAAVCYVKDRLLADRIVEMLNG